MTQETKIDSIGSIISNECYDASLAERLRGWATLKTADAVPNDWARQLSELLNEAANEIEYLWSLVGAISPGEGSFRDIAKDLPRSEPKKSRPTQS